MEGASNQRSAATPHLLSSSQGLDARNGRRMAFRTGGRGNTCYHRASSAVPLSDRRGLVGGARRRKILYRQRREKDVSPHEGSGGDRRMNGNGRAHHRVAVTGIGVITPIGTGVGEFWDATLAGKVGIK